MTAGGLNVCFLKLNMLTSQLKQLNKLLKVVD